MSKKSNASKHLVKYTITAIVTKIISEGKVVLNGVGKHRYENSKGEIFNLLENVDDAQNPKLFKLDVEYAIKDKGAVTTTLLAMAMLNKRPLQLTVEEMKIEDNPESEYSIKEVEVP